MRKVSLRSFQLKPTKYLKDLPIALTRYGKVICFIGPLPKAVSKHFRKEEKKKEAIAGAHSVTRGDDVKLCKHGAQIGLCKYGCKK